MKAVKWFIVIILIAVVAAVLLNSTYKTMLEPVDSSATDSQVIVDIPVGSGTETIAEILFDNGLIKNTLAFRIMARKNGYDHRFKAGRYILSRAMSTEEQAEIIASGEVYSETVWFTIPEGFTVEEIALRLEENGLVNNNRFLSLVKDPPPGIMEKYPLLAEAASPDIEYLLEGYLFPDTYEVYREAGEEDIIRLMVERLFQVIGEEGLNRAAEMNRSIHEILTIASIVEREARVDHERPLIAGVFYNRLQIGQRLESCATIQYILGEYKEFLSYHDLETPSPYNTYQNAGLPPGPIAAAGASSINAALNPEQSNYYYFNYKYDESGEHYFSRTLQEHNQNVARAEANLQ